MGSTPQPLKKQQTALVVWFRLYGEDRARMEKLTNGARGRHNDIAYDGTMKQVAFLEAQAHPVTPAEAKVIAEFKKVTRSEQHPHGADIVPVIKAAMRDSVQRQAAAAAKKS